MRPESVMVEFFVFSPLLSFNKVRALDPPLNQDGVLRFLRRSIPLKSGKGFQPFHGRSLEHSGMGKVVER